MQAQMKVWEDGLGVSMSKAIFNATNLNGNDNLQVSVIENKIIMEQAFQHRTLRERADEYGGELHLSEEINWGEPSGDEVY